MSDAVLAASRFVLKRYAEDSTPPDLVASIEDALRHGLVVTFHIVRDDDTPLFELHPFQGVVHVMGWRGDHLATCARVETALSRAWEYASPVRPAEQDGRTDARGVGKGRRRRLK